VHDSSPKVRAERQTWRPHDTRRREVVTDLVGDTPAGRNDRKSREIGAGKDEISLRFKQRMSDGNR
jgi:hypothetical protein